MIKLVGRAEMVEISYLLFPKASGEEPPKMLFKIPGNHGENGEVLSLIKS